MRLLVIDDSAVMRQSMIAICKRARDIEVTVAADPLIAQSKIAHSRPDVILLDLEMPRMDGLTFLRRQMHDDPIPVVVCSALAGAGTEMAVRALEEGAVDVVPKPRIALHEFLHESTELLLDAIRGAAAARLRRPCHPERSRGTLSSSRRPRSLDFARDDKSFARDDVRAPLARTTRKVVAIGASTGGTEALRVLLEAMPADAPGMVIVQHMPELFTAAFARRLDETCRVEVKEAAHGDRVLEGRALIAPGSRHLEVVRDGAEYRVTLHDGPLVSRHRPSVDVLFRSVAKSAGMNAVGVILTGMGSDGAAGLLDMRHAGAVTLAQNEATSIVFGMPKEAIARGAAQEVLPLDGIAPAILRSLTV